MKSLLSLLDLLWWRMELALTEAWAKLFSPTMADRRVSGRRDRERRFCPFLAVEPLEARQVLSVNVAAPQVTPAQIFEGDLVTVAATFTDSQNDDHVGQVSWGDATTTTPSLTEPQGQNPGSVTGTHTYVDDGSFTVAVTVTDVDAPTDTETERVTVSVQNADPTIAPFTAGPIDEGEGVTISVRFSDPGLKDFDTSQPLTVMIDWGDGQGALATQVTLQAVAGSPGTYEFSATSPADYDVSGMYTIEVQVTDKDGGAGTASATLTVRNVAPAISSFTANPTTINEGQTATITLQFSDPGGGESYTVHLDRGDGTFIDVTSLGTLSSLGGGDYEFTANVTFLDDTTQIRAEVRDSDGGISSTAAAALTVNNVAPSITAVQAPAIFEGDFAEVAVEFKDPGSDSFQVFIDWGDGNGLVLSTGTLEDLGGGNYRFTATSPAAYSDNRQVAIRAQVVDDDNGASNVAGATLSVVNVAPTITAVTAPPINEGDFATVTVEFTDPGSDSFQVFIDWGDGILVQSTGTLTSLGNGNYRFTATSPAPYPDNGQVTVRAGVVDDDTGASNVVGATLSVVNVAPTITAVTAPPINEGDLATVTVAFTDPGADTFVILIDWGDGSLDPATGTLTALGNGQYTFTATSPARYPDDAQVAIQVQVVDDDNGQSAIASVDLTVNNVRPTIIDVVLLPNVINEGQNATVRVEFSDPGLDDFTSGGTALVEIDWGDGQGPQQTAVTLTLVPGPPGTNTYIFTATSPETYRIDGTHTITVTVPDDRAVSDPVSRTLQVLNVAPILGPLQAGPLFEGDPLSFTMQFTDPGLDDFTPGGRATMLIDWGDGKGAQSTTVTLTTVDAHAGVYEFTATSPFDTVDNGAVPVSVTLSDSDGATAVRAGTLAVQNVTPMVTITGIDPIDEGQPGTLVVQFTDPGLQDFFVLGPQIVSIDWGDGIGTQFAIVLLQPVGAVPGTYQFVVTAPATYRNDGTFPVAVFITDKDLATGVGSASLTVNNVAPTIRLSTMTSPDILEGQTSTLVVQFQDPGLDDFSIRAPLNVSVEWGDGSQATIPVQLSSLGPGLYEFRITHLYVDNAQPDGTPFTIRLSFQDDVAPAVAGFQVAAPTLIVRNASPQIGTLTVNPTGTPGEGLLTLEFTDPGIRDTPTVVVNWGDQGRGGQTFTTQDLVQVAPGVWQLTAEHLYAFNASPFQIQVLVSDSDGAVTVSTAELVLGSAAVVRPEIATQPALNLILPAPEVPPTDPAASTPQLERVESPSSAQASIESADVQIVLRVVLPSGEEVTVDVLDTAQAGDVLSLLRRLLDNRYRVYVIRGDGTERLMLDVVVRQGRLSDPEDGSEPFRQRPPVEEGDTSPVPTPDMHGADVGGGLPDVERTGAGESVAAAARWVLPAEVSRRSGERVAAAAAP